MIARILARNLARAPDDNRLFIEAVRAELSVLGASPAIGGPANIGVLDVADSLEVRLVADLHLGPDLDTGFIVVPGVDLPVVHRFRSFSGMSR